MGDQQEERVGPTAMGEQLGACRDRIEELAELLQDERSRRDQLVVAARDEQGLSYGRIARYAGLTKSRVIAILAAN